MNDGLRPIICSLSMVWGGSMWLSRLCLNAALWLTASNGYMLHQIIERGIDPGDDERALWRIEGDTLIAQTRYPPDWTAVERRKLAMSEVRPYYPTINAGDSLSFRLCANPTIKLARAGDDGQGKRVGLTGEAGQRAWLERKAALGGFVVTDLTIRCEGHRCYWRPRDRRMMNLLTVEYGGVLTVLDAERFATTLAQGIGPAKGLGYGLLLLNAPEARWVW